MTMNLCLLSFCFSLFLLLHCTFHIILHKGCWPLSILTQGKYLQGSESMKIPLCRLQPVLHGNWLLLGEQEKLRGFPRICTPECAIQFFWKSPMSKVFYVGRIYLNSSSLSILINCNLFFLLLFCQESSFLSLNSTGKIPILNLWNAKKKHFSKIYWLNGKGYVEERNSSR